MAKLIKAIGEQIERMTEEPEIIFSPPTETDHLLRAMTALLNAYRQSLETPPGFVIDPETQRLRAKVSDTFATNG